MGRLNAPTKIPRQQLGRAPGSNLTIDVCTHTVVEDDRLVAKQSGQRPCRNVARSAQEEPSQIAKAW